MEFYVRRWALILWLDVNQILSEIQSLLDMNVKHLDGWESAPCSRMLSITSADMKIKWNKQNPPVLTWSKTCYFLESGLKRREGVIQKKCRRRSKLCPGSSISSLLPPTYRYGCLAGVWETQTELIICHESIWAAWCPNQSATSSGLTCFESVLLRQFCHFYKILGCFLEHRLLLPSCS